MCYNNQQLGIVNAKLVKMGNPQDSMFPMVWCVRVLGWCSVLLSRLSAVEKVCEIYAAAAKAAPHSEEILTHLFMAYVRVGDYQRQQQVGS